ncbi:hypothetical protein ACHHRT_13745, partial [Desulfurivibrio sp. D14AmB]|uniref:hypothetical protein n=1 Tax=Desulfurivibrio sp. D14AmB TaxID=3374370 RepID=UPI00376EB420
VTLDAMAVAVAGSADASINGNYDACQESTNWSGSGRLAAGIDIGGEVKAKTPKEIIVLHGSLKGETGVSQSITIESTDMVISASWDGITVKGDVTLRLYNRRIIDESVSKVLLEKKPTSPISWTLPSLQ